MTAGTFVDETGLFIDFEKAQRNRDMIELMRQAEQERMESKNDGRQRNYSTQEATRKSKLACRFW